MANLSCVGRDGVSREFCYDCKFDQLNAKWTYRVRTVPPLESGEFFELDVVVLDESRVRVLMANNHGVLEYSAAGIPEALLPKIALQLDRSVVSSPGHGKTADMYRNQKATKYWKRLCNLGLALYDSVEDYYTLPNPTFQRTASPPLN